jgi:hypothetical protein
MVDGWHCDFAGQEAFSLENVEWKESPFRGARSVIQSGTLQEFRKYLA